jgi:hypothetical protein
MFNIIKQGVTDIKYFKKKLDEYKDLGNFLEENKKNVDLLF